MGGNVVPHVFNALKEAVLNRNRCIDEQTRDLECVSVCTNTVSISFVFAVLVLYNSVNSLPSHY